MKERFNLNLHPDIKDKLEMLAKKNNRSLSQMVETLIVNEHNNTKSSNDDVRSIVESMVDEKVQKYVSEIFIPEKHKAKSAALFKKIAEEMKKNGT